MNDIVKVLHITAHLGGGVGKALSGLVLQSAASASNVEHVIVTLEAQKKPQFSELIKNCGCQVVTCPAPARLCELIEAADIVQLEWWNHPATIKALCSHALPPMRLLVWSHVSGLYNPIIPRDLILAAQQFLFTSSCSFEAREVTGLPGAVRGRIGVVSSCGGFDGLPWPELRGDNRLVTGYIGSLNFAKLHPRYVEFLCAVDVPEFTVRLIGDVTNKEILEEQCKKAGREGLLEFRGYSTDIASELKAVNVLAYLLNPEHYGTAENALLEAMAMGIVPVVLDNPAEREIIEDSRTGLVVNSPSGFANAVRWLADNPAQRQKMGRQAAESVRRKFAVQKMAAFLDSHYAKLLLLDKREISFAGIFGPEPADWFLSCQGNREFFTLPDMASQDPESFSIHALMEATKGSVFHFHKSFPDDARLRKWADSLLLLQKSF